MKKLLWLTIPILLLAAYFALPQIKNQPDAEIESRTAQVEDPGAVTAVDPVSLSISPTTIIQGEPARITIDGLASASTIASLTLDGKPLGIFDDEGRLATLVGIDFHKNPGSYPLTLTLTDGRKVEEKIEVGKRVVATEEFDIPEQLGGNTPQAEQELTHTLSQDATTLDAITTIINPEKLWSGEFRLPLDGAITVTDTYGYKRQTGSVGLSHLGTDFRASMGTSVYAMNAGKVAFAGTLRNFGHTVIIDHGLGVMTMYMHLSEIDVNPGDRVEKGGLIARSGNSGYSLGPHLHLSVRIGGFSIDPLKFLELMGPK